MHCDSLEFLTVMLLTTLGHWAFCVWVFYQSCILPGGEMPHAGWQHLGSYLNFRVRNHVRNRIYLIGDLGPARII